MRMCEEHTYRLLWFPRPAQTRFIMQWGRSKNHPLHTLHNFFLFSFHFLSHCDLSYRLIAGVCSYCCMCSHSTTHTHSAELLWTGNMPVAETSNGHQSGGIQTCKSSRQVAAVPCPRQLGDPGSAIFQFTALIYLIIWLHQTTADVNTLYVRHKTSCFEILSLVQFVLVFRLLSGANEVSLFLECCCSAHHRRMKFSVGLNLLGIQHRQQN